LIEVTTFVVISQKLQNAVTVTHTLKIVVRILRRMIERKIEDVFGYDQFGFRKGKENRDAFVMLRII
jgi:hypothetical protein